MEREPQTSGFGTTLAALTSCMASCEEPAEAMPLLGLALAERGSVAREALRFLLGSRQPAAAGVIVEGFHHLEAVERAQVLSQSSRLLTQASPLLSGRSSAGRVGLAELAAALPPRDSLGILLPLLEDPLDEVRLRARRGVLAAAAALRGGSWTPSGPAESRRFHLAAEAALRDAEAGEADLLLASLLRAAQVSAGARVSLRSLAARPAASSQETLLQSLERIRDPETAPLLLEFLASSQPAVRARAAAALGARREPDFLRALAREVTARMETPAGISGFMVEALAEVQWEFLAPADLAALPASAQRRLLWIVRTGRGEIQAGARRRALFLQSRDRRIRELALDALRPEPPSGYWESLLPLLSDPAEELQLRAAELLARVPAPQCRNALVERARSAPERVRAFIFEILRAGGPASAAGPREPLRTAAGSRSFEEHSFPRAATRAGFRIG